jgi:hypothetical protein
MLCLARMESGQLTDGIIEDDLATLVTAAESKLMAGYAVEALLARSHWPAGWHGLGRGWWLLVDP